MYCHVERRRRPGCRTTGAAAWPLPSVPEANTGCSWGLRASSPMTVPLRLRCAWEMGTTGPPACRLSDADDCHVRPVSSLSSACWPDLSIPEVSVLVTAADSVPSVRQAVLDNPLAAVEGLYPGPLSRQSSFSPLRPAPCRRTLPVTMGIVFS